MTNRSEDDLMRSLRKSSKAEVDKDSRRIAAGVNFDHLTTLEADALWLAFFAGHGWSYGDWLDTRGIDPDTTPEFFAKE